MKQQNTYNDSEASVDRRPLQSNDALVSGLKAPDSEAYQKILAELQPGADEYDRLMAEGLNPAKKVSRHSFYWYAAACAILLLIGSATYFALNNDSENSSENLIAKTEVKQNIPERKEKPQEEISVSNEAETIQPATISRTHKKKANKPTVEQAAETADQISVDRRPLTVDQTSVDQNESEASLAPTLIAEIEMRALREEQFQREIIEEIYTNIIELPNKPELTL